MIQLGIFAKTFIRPTFEATFAVVQAHGLDCLQFNFACAGLPTLPDWIDPRLARRIRDELLQRAMSMAAVSGTCNLIHPEPARREKGLANLEVLVRTCHQLGTSIVTLCTGTRHQEDMWQAHPDNGSPEAWLDLVHALERLLSVAQENNVILCVEPEPANVINSAARARQLLDEMRSPHLKIIFDAANLLSRATLGRQQKVLREAIDQLGPDIVLAHAKDLAAGDQSTHPAAGRGELDYPFYLSVLHEAGIKGPLILHSLRENEVDEAVAFVRGHLRRLSATQRE